MHGHIIWEAKAALHLRTCSALLLERNVRGKQGTWDEHTECWPNMRRCWRAQPFTQEEDAKQWEAAGDTSPNMGRKGTCPP